MSISGPAKACEQRGGELKYYYQRNVSGFLISEQLNEQICKSDPTDPTDKICYKQTLVFLVPNWAGPSPTPELRNTV